MTKRTRIFLVSAGSILVLGLGTGVIASYMGLENVVTLGGGAPDELAYVPEDTHVLAFANVREVMDSELRAKIMGLRPDRPDTDATPDVDGDLDSARESLFEATGLDVEKDIDSVLASLTSGNTGQPLLIAKGRFNNGLIEAAILQHANAGDRATDARVEDYRGTRLVVFNAGNEGAMAVAFAEPGVLVLGPQVSVQRALDVKASGTNVTDNAAVMNLVRDSEDGNAWAIARFDALTGRAQLPQEIASQLPPITWFAAKGHINGGLRATLRAETKDDASAQNLRDVIRGFMALARLQAGQREEFAAVLNSLELGGTGKTVSLGFAVDSSIIDALGALGHLGGRTVLPGMAPMPPLPPLPPADVL